MTYLTKLVFLFVTSSNEILYEQSCHKVKKKSENKNQKSVNRGFLKIQEKSGNLILSKNHIKIIILSLRTLKTNLFKCFYY